MTAAQMWRRGFVQVPRALLDHPRFRPLPSSQKWVAIALWHLANFEDGGYYCRGEYITVRRGQLAYSLKTLSEITGESIKTVRLTIDRLSVGHGLSDHLLEKTQNQGTKRGTNRGTVPNVITVRHYDNPGEAPEDEGTERGAGEGKRGARQGHARGTHKKKGKKENNDQEANSRGNAKAFDRLKQADRAEDHGKEGTYGF